MVDDLKYYDGIISEIERIPAELKELYRTAFEIEPRWLIECASRRQKWIGYGPVAESLSRAAQRKTIERDVSARVGKRIEDDLLSPLARGDAD